MRHLLKQFASGAINVEYARRQLAKQRILDYFKVKMLNSTRWESSKRNVPLLRPNEKEFIGRFGGNVYAWKHARALEGRQHTSLMEGCYGLSQKRAEHFVGALPKDFLSDFDDIANVSLEHQKYAKRFRIFAYFPINDTSSFVELHSLHGMADCSVYINSDWYDPPNGVIPASTTQPAICGTHSFTPTFDFATKQFHFENSWGWEWGDMGSGSFDLEYFENNVTEMLGHAGITDYYDIESDFDVCVGWKWSLSEKFSIHARELIEGNTGDRMGWTFGTRVGRELVIHEFFVWPSYRGRGLAKKLADEIILLCNEAKLKPRLKVPFVDCVDGRIDGVVAVGKMLGVELSESTDRFHCLDGMITESRLRQLSITRTPPPPAASPLEWIRRPPELPLVEAVGVPVLFGTNRIAVAMDESVSFGNTRGDGLSCGFRVVQVENIQRFGSAGRTWHQSIMDFGRWMRGQFGELKKDEAKTNLLDPKSFGDLSRFLYSSTEDRHHLVYVHGFNTTFEFAMNQAARLKADLKLKGNVFLFSWPSAGNVASYSSDEAAIEAAFPHFLSFMGLVEESVSGESLSVLAHSMGNRLLARMIDQRSSNGMKRKLKHAIFAAPDVDHDVFEHSIQSWSIAFERATLYANSADLALQLSEIKHKFPRAGLVPPIVDVPNLETILVQGFDLFDLCHGYFAQAGNTLHDMFVALRFNCPADERPGTRRIAIDSPTRCWSISHK